jgi:hypothetical protein
VEAPPLLIRRDAQRKLSLAIAWFLAAPIFVLGFLTIILPLVARLPADCFELACERQPFDPSPLAVAAVCVVALGAAALLLYRLSYRRPRLAWSIVAGIGGALVVAALVVDVLGHDGALILMTLIWPMTPGLIAIDAARRGRRAILGVARQGILR